MIMQENKVLTDTLKRCLHSAGMTYQDVALALELSEASVKRVFSKGTFSVKRLEQVCALMDMRIGDLCRLADKLHSDRRTTLSLEQETALVESAELLRYFYRLLSGWAVADINQAHDLDELRAIRLLAHLDRLRLIELQPKNKVRMQPLLPMGVTAVNTVILLVSGVAMVLTWRQLANWDRKKILRRLLLTAALGSVFLLLQGFEWVRLISFGLTLSSSVYGAIFYTLIGCHALHVLGALIWLVGVALRFQYKPQSYGPARHLGIKLIGMYWILVVALWPILYGLVYLS